MGSKGRITSTKGPHVALGHRMSTRALTHLLERASNGTYHIRLPSSIVPINLLQAQIICPCPLSMLQASEIMYVLICLIERLSTYKAAKAFPLRAQSAECHFIPLQIAGAFSLCSSKQLFSLQASFYHQLPHDFCSFPANRIDRKLFTQLTT